MLIEFRLGNFFSFAQKTTLSMVASEESFLLTENTTAITDYCNVLKTSIVLGEKNTGKSNLLKGFSTMRTILFKELNSKKIFLNTFSLDKKYHCKPCFFQVVLFLNNHFYRYGFEYSHNKIIKEWLFTNGNKQQITLFTRNKHRIFIHPEYFPDIKKYSTELDDCLLSFLARKDNDNIAFKIKQWFLTSFVYQKPPASIFYHKEKTLNLLSKLGLNPILFKDKKKLSKRQKQLLNICNKLTLVLDAGGCLFVDDLDHSMDVTVINALLNLLRSTSFNPLNAQLIATVHQPKLLNNEQLRLDQIWFIERTGQKASHLFSLCEFIQDDSNNLEMKYLTGCYVWKT